MKDLTGVVVSYNNRDALMKSIDSVRNFYPDLHIIVVEVSDKKNVTSRAYIDTLENVTKLYFDYNISHGRGLHIGITSALTKYVLCFDNDIKVEWPCVEKMLGLFEKDTLMVGKTVKLPQSSYAIKLSNKKDITYVYPHFHIVNQYEYRKYYPYVHSAAPGQILFPQLTDTNMEHALKHFDDLDNCVTHYQGTTSNGYGDNQLPRSPEDHMNNWVLQTEFFDKCKK